MNAAHFTLAPQFPGRRERAPFVPILQPSPKAARSARHARTWAPGWPSLAATRSPLTRPEGFLGIWLEGLGAVLDSNRARYERPPQPWRDVANMRTCPSASRATCWVRNANRLLGRCESANLSRLLTRRAFA